jgi:hypothetical protein
MDDAAFAKRVEMYLGLFEQAEKDQASRKLNETDYLRQMEALGKMLDEIRKDDVDKIDTRMLNTPFGPGPGANDTEAEDRRKKLDELRRRIEQMSDKDYRNLLRTRIQKKPAEPTQPQAAFEIPAWAKLAALLGTFTALILAYATEGASGASFVSLNTLILFAAAAVGAKAASKATRLRQPQSKRAFAYSMASVGCGLLMASATAAIIYRQVKPALPETAGMADVLLNAETMLPNIHIFVWTIAALWLMACYAVLRSIYPQNPHKTILATALTLAIAAAAFAAAASAADAAIERLAPNQAQTEANIRITPQTLEETSPDATVREEATEKYTWRITDKTAAFTDKGNTTAKDCEKIPEETRNLCLNTVAEKLKDPTICRQIREARTNASEATGTDRCLTALAKTAQNPPICDMIASPTQRQACLRPLTG